MDVESPRTPPLSCAFRPIWPDRPMIGSVTRASRPMRESAHAMAPDRRAFSSTLAVLPQHGVRSEPRPGVDNAALIDEQWALELRLRWTRAVGATHAMPGLPLNGGIRVPAVHDVAMYLHVLFWRADVDPVVAINRGEKRLAALDERGKEAALDRPGHICRECGRTSPARARRCRR